MVNLLLCERYTGGFADLKDTIICGVVGLICVIFIVKRTINFLKRKSRDFLVCREENEDGKLGFEGKKEWKIKSQ